MTKTNQQTFESIVRWMSVSQIVRAMTAGLRKRHVVVFMDTYGDVSDDGKTCFGCAATNTICEITGKVFTPSVIASGLDRAAYINAGYVFLTTFEGMVDQLRCGRLDSYNGFARDIRIATIPESFLDTHLPRLDEDFTEEQLQKYDRFADEMEKAGVKK